LKRLLVISLLFLAAITLAAQTTKVRGHVIDASNGDPVPFTGVFFVGTQVGVSADQDGLFSLTTRDMSMTTVRAQMLGYDIVDIEIKPGIFNEINFFLNPQENALNAIVVKPDNSLAKKLLANIDAHRDRNNPEAKEGYKCDVYSRMELDLTYPEQQLTSKRLKKQWGFIFDYVDTSEISGIPYLPVLINESVTERLHSRNPEVDREIVKATQLSGADPSGNLVSQFTGSMHLKNNFYSQFLNVFNVEIPSPINSNGTVFYNYFIIDTLVIDGRKTLMVRYHPKPAISTPSFDGELLIDAEDFALKRVKARLVKGQNINWVRDMVLEANYERVGDSTWFYSQDRFYADFSVTTLDSLKVMSFLGNRNLVFSNPVFEKPALEASATVVKVDSESGYKNEEYWDAARPYPLSNKEKNIYYMVNLVQDTKLYRNLYDVVYTIINGYWDIGKIGIGPYSKVFTYNPLEGFRIRLGMHTSVDWSKKDRFTVYAAFGCKDLEVKGGGTWEHLFSKEPTRKLTLDAHYDVLQLGKGTNKFTTDNIFASLFGAGKSSKLCPVVDVSAVYDHEFMGSLNGQFEALYREFHGNQFVPMVTPLGEQLELIPSFMGRASLRFSHNETVTRGHFIKTYTHTDYPVLTLDLNGGASYVDSYCDGFFRPELSLDWKFRIPPIGMTTLHLNGGTIVGKVPYTLLHLHEGNGTFLLDKTSFSCMNFMEFASDSWVTFMLDHNFYGFFLGKIPFIKKLQMREALVFKMTWGDLSDKNNGLRGKDSQGLLLFPEGMNEIGSIPYIEAGFGITNILRLFRVDFIWRCTHREDIRENPRNFVVNFGLELKF